MSGEIMSFEDSPFETCCEMFEMLDGLDHVQTVPSKGEIMRELGIVKTRRITIEEMKDAMVSASGDPFGHVACAILSGMTRCTFGTSFREIMKKLYDEGVLKISDFDDNALSILIKFKSIKQHIRRV